MLNIFFRCDVFIRLSVNFLNNFCTKTMRIYLLILFTLVLGACTKTVETVYNKDKDLTRFTTRPFKAEKKNKEIELVAEKECAGKVICTDQEFKFTQGPRREGDPAVVLAKSDLAEKLLGWRAKHSDANTLLETTLRAYRQSS